MKPSPFFRLFLAVALLGTGGGVLAFALSNILMFPVRVGLPDKVPAIPGTPFVARNAAGQKIAAWWYPGDPAAGAVLLCHGHCVNHLHILDMAGFLHDAGYNILALDFRAHGLSEGRYTTIGLHEWEDIAAVLEAAEANGFLPPTMRLAAYGRSMGAATLANGSARLGRIGAFILESSFAELRKIAGRDVRRVSGIPDVFLLDWLFSLARMRSGIDYASNRPVEGIKGVGGRPLLLIHDGLDPRATREDHDRLKAAVPGAKEMLVPDAGHVQAHRPPPAPFEPIVLQFLNDAGVLPAPSR
ncbi:MAG TPA: alpha/beta hydrolase [Candidatus Ozemobacteraceae bacterium]|nr:alpha/beta hydrolase [Candidatus Ozemobacteraceae bacterium]HQG28143.1 alpha/beta hydrolase [Candidatus Ozemobacteraceae bacterium]